MATRKAIGLKSEPHAPPKKVYLPGPTAGYGSISWSGSMKEYIVFVAETPAPPALSTHPVIYSVRVEFGDNLTKTGPLY